MSVRSRRARKSCRAPWEKAGSSEPRRSTASCQAQVDDRELDCLRIGRPSVRLQRDGRRRQAGGNGHFSYGPASQCTLMRRAGGSVSLDGGSGSSRATNSPLEAWADKPLAQQTTDHQKIATA